MSPASASYARCVVPLSHLPHHHDNESVKDTAYDSCHEKFISFFRRDAPDEVFDLLRPRGHEPLLKTDILTQ